ncbi:hypothetical protein [Actinoplanes sp. NPDC051494]|uniref:hypothetical protein n=1 Tax=Actinoplanes sp. NPDC051494 TaxID=3363907 RepID=UPI003788B838
MQRAVVAGFALAVLASGSAYGYWSTAGSGSGSATTGAPVALTLTQGTSTGFLYPGGTSDVALMINNPNTFAVRVNQLALDTSQGTGGFGVDAGHSTCGVAAVSYTTQNNSGGWTVAASGTLSLSLTGALAMSLSAPNACQGATFRVYLSTS